MPLSRPYLRGWCKSLFTGDIYNAPAESGVIASLILHPDYAFHSEELTPHHFYDNENGYIYYAITELAKRSIDKVDAFNIQNVLNAHPATRIWAEKLTVQAINGLIEKAPIISAKTVAEYKISVHNVMDAAFRREAIQKLQECEQLCRSDDESENIKTRIYKEIESLVCRYEDIEDIAPLGVKMDELWEQIANAQKADGFVDFPFPSLGRYMKISRTDAIVIAAREKRGKSLMLLNLAVDLLKKGKRVLVIDTELDTKLYIMRLISHLTGIEFARIRDGNIDDSEKSQIEDAKNWIKSMPITHVYRPAIDDDQLISITRKHMHKYGLDVLILDYLKGNTSYFLDAYQNSAVLGKTMDTLKNYIAGELNLFVLTAVQATRTGTIADSQKIIRNCSGLLYLERKTPEQIQADGGLEFGNMTLNVRANRNGEIMSEDEYISLTLDGNRCLFFESKQPERRDPF